MRKITFSILTVILSILILLVSANLFFHLKEKDSLFNLNKKKIVLVPNMSATISSDGFKNIRIRTNNLGFIGPDFNTKTGDKLSILTIGGSTTLCLALGFNGGWPYRLDKKLSRSFNSIWLNNAGLEGHSTRGHLILMEEFYPIIKPKVAIFLVGINDLVVALDWEIDKQNVENKFGNFLEFLGSDSRSDFKIPLPRRRRREFNLNYSTEPELDDVFLQKFHPKLSREELKHKKELFRERYSVLLSKYKTRLQQIVDISLAQNILPIFVTQPTVASNDKVDPTTKRPLFEVYLGETSDFVFYGGVLDTALNEMNKIVIETSKQNNLKYVDLGSFLEKDSRYYYDSVHFRHAGAEEVSRILYNELCPYLQIKFPDFKSVECKNL